MRLEENLVLILSKDAVSAATIVRADFRPDSGEPAAAGASKGEVAP